MSTDVGGFGTQCGVRKEMASRTTLERSAIDGESPVYESELTPSVSGVGRDT